MSLSLADLKRAQEALKREGLDYGDLFNIRTDLMLRKEMFDSWLRMLHEGRYSLEGTQEAWEFHRTGEGCFAGEPPT